MPGALWVDPNGPSQPQVGTDSLTRFVYHPLRGVRRSQFAILFESGRMLLVYASTAPGQCQLQGTPIAVGSGITGYRDDTFAHPPPSGMGAAGGWMSFVTGGLYVNLWLSANPEGETQGQYWATFGPVWQHMLASFVPAPTIPNGHRFI